MSNDETSKSKANQKPGSYRRPWLSLTGVMTLSFLLLGYYGRDIYYAAPPIPKQVVTLQKLRTPDHFKCQFQFRGHRKSLEVDNFMVLKQS